jgi:hypothetical protein
MQEREKCLCSNRPKRRIARNKHDICKRIKNLEKQFKDGKISLCIFTLALQNYLLLE